MTDTSRVIAICGGAADPFSIVLEPPPPGSEHFTAFNQKCDDLDSEYLMQPINEADYDSETQFLIDRRDGGPASFYDHFVTRRRKKKSRRGFLIEEPMCGRGHGFPAPGAEEEDDDEHAATAHKAPGAAQGSYGSSEGHAAVATSTAETEAEARGDSAALGHEFASRKVSSTTTTTTTTTTTDEGTSISVSDFSAPRSAAARVHTDPTTNADIPSDTASITTTTTTTTTTVTTTTTTRVTLASQAAASATNVAADDDDAEAATSEGGSDSGCERDAEADDDDGASAIAASSRRAQGGAARKQFRRRPGQPAASARLAPPPPPPSPPPPPPAPKPSATSGLLSVPAATRRGAAARALPVSESAMDYLAAPGLSAYGAPPKGALSNPAVRRIACGVMPPHLRVGPLAPVMGASPPPSPDQSSS